MTCTSASRPAGTPCPETPLGKYCNICGRLAIPGIKPLCLACDDAGRVVFRGEEIPCPACSDLAPAMAQHSTASFGSAGPRAGGAA